MNPSIPEAISTRERFAQRSEAVLSRLQIPILIAFTFAYGSVTWYRAQRKLFWFDEVFTDYISQLPDVGHIWHALIQGADFNPPLMYVVTRASQSLLGHTEAATRLPQMVGFWLFCLCLYRFVSVRTNVFGGLIAMLFPCVTVAYYYACEARAHGIVLGFCGLALVSWQVLTSNSRYRIVAAVALFLSLSCALLTHSYALLLWVPLTAGELVRTYRSRRVDYLIWIALGSAAVCILVSLPLLHAARSLLGVGQFLPATPKKIAYFYARVFSPGAGVLTLILVCLCLDRWIGRQRGLYAQRMPVHEWVTVLTFLGMPVIAYGVALITGGPFMDRYSISVVASLACLLGMTASQRWVTGTAIITLLMLQTTFDFLSFRNQSQITEPSVSHEVSTYKPSFDEKYALINSAGEKGLKVLLVDELEFAPILYYASPDLRPRLFYPRDGHTNHTGFDGLRKCCGAPGDTVSIPDMVRSRTEFFVCCESLRWPQDRQLQVSPGVIVVEKSNDYGTLLRVTYPQVGSGASVQ